MKNRFNNILRLLLISFCFISFAGFAVAQDSTVVDDSGMKPVRNPWTTGMLIDHQTTETPNKGAFEFAIHHRFGKILELDDLYGIYSSSNIRLGVTYGITKDIAIGFGTEKDNKMQEFTGKYKILSQTRNGKIPVSVTYFGNIVIDTRDKELFGTDYKFLNRLSFFNQVIVSRKVTRALSVQAAFSLSHFNAVKELTTDSVGNVFGKWKNDYIGASLAARYKFYNNISAIVEYSHPFALAEPWDGQEEPMPNMGIGVEFGTSTHAFQVFAANYQDIIAQENYSHNLNDMAFEGWRFGFNITVRF